MAEKTLADPLNGAEIKEIILQEIEKRMNGDCTLLNDLAHGRFAFQFEIKIQYTAPVGKTLVWGVGGSSQEPIKAEDVAESTVLAGSYASEAPNIARTDHDLPIPVMVQTPTGPVRQRVHIEGKRGPGRPKLSRDQVS